MIILIFLRYVGRSTDKHHHSSPHLAEPFGPLQARYSADNPGVIFYFITVDAIMTRFQELVPIRARLPKWSHKKAQFCLPSPKFNKIKSGDFPLKNLKNHDKSEEVLI